MIGTIATPTSSTRSNRVVPLRAVFDMGFLVGCLFAATSLPRTRWHWVCCWSAGFILPLGNTIIPAALAETAVFLPHVYDEEVVRLDAAFGGQVSFALGRLLANHTSVRQICAFVYAAVLFPAGWLALMEGRIGRRCGLGSIPTFLTIAGVGFVIYHVLPVIGPRAYFGSAFPLHPAHPSLNMPRNAMPSLHTAWVLMAWLCARGMKKTRIVLGIFLAIMLLATMGLGEHYLVDLICAAPFVLLLRALCATDLRWSVPVRHSAALIGAAIFGLWGLAVRGIVHPADMPGLVPVLAIATLVISWTFERWLAHAQGLPMSAAPWAIAQALIREGPIRRP